MVTQETFSQRYLREASMVLLGVDATVVERLAYRLTTLRERGGRLFLIGSGGSASTAAHAVADFRCCGIEAYAPDSIADLTARVNDHGWDQAYSSWLVSCRLGIDDAVLVFSVSGGDADSGVSVNLEVLAKMARHRGTAMYGVLGREEGLVAQYMDLCVIVPPLYPERATGHAEGTASVLAHLLANHPALTMVSPEQRERLRLPNRLKR